MAPVATADPRARRGTIRDAAASLFASCGFTSTTTSAVAEAAGVAHGTVFLHFASKDVLFEAAVLEPLAELDRLLIVADRQAEPVAPQLRTMIDEQIGVIASHGEYLRLVLYVIGQADRFPALARRLRGFAQRRIEALASIVARGQRQGELGPGDPKLIALSFFAYLQGVAITVPRPPRGAAREALAEAAFRLFAPRAMPGQRSR